MSYGPRFRQTTLHPAFCALKIGKKDVAPTDFLLRNHHVITIYPHRAYAIPSVSGGGCSLLDGCGDGGLLPVELTLNRLLDGRFQLSLDDALEKLSEHLPVYLPHKFDGVDLEGETISVRDEAQENLPAVVLKIEVQRSIVFAKLGAVGAHALDLGTRFLEGGVENETRTVKTG